MKKRILFIILFMPGMIACAQNFGWAKRLGGTNDETAISTAVDGSGNVYTTGWFAGTADFDPGPGTFNLISSGGKDIFVSKVDSSGNFLWAKSMNEPNFVQNQGNDIAVDNQGNVYTTGFYSLTTDFDPGAGTYNLTANGNAQDIFISKLSPTGNFIWAKSIGGANSDYGFSIAVDDSGNVYTSGLYFDVVDFDPGPNIFNLNPSGMTADIFISKLNSSGNFIWAKSLGGPNTGDFGQAIACDDSGNVYTTGYFSNTADFDPGPATFNITSTGSWDAFVSKLNSSGNFVWAKNLGGAGDDQGRSIAVDSLGNVYTTGQFYGTVDFDPGAGIYNLNSVGGSRDIFISKLDAFGSFLWAKSIGGTGDDVGISLKTDRYDNVITAGLFHLTADFDPGAGIDSIASTGGNDIFISKLDASGNFLWAATMGGINDDFGWGVDLDATGHIYTTGAFSGTADFDPGAGIYNLMASGTSDIYISKLVDCTGATAPVISANGTTTFCSGSNVTLSVPLNAISYQWKKNGVAISGATSTSYISSTSGNYTVTVVNVCGSFTSPTLTVTVNPLPTTSISAGGPLTFCQGDSVTLNAIVNAAYSYQWKRNGTNIAGAVLSKYVPKTSGTYKVVILNTLTGCSKTTNTGTIVTVNPKPSASFTANGPVSFCAGGSVVFTAVAAGMSYQWRKNGADIAGANLINYTATTAGNYKLRTTNAFGCTNLTSQATVVTIPCREEEELENSPGEISMHIFPNPVSDNFNVEFNLTQSGRTVLSVLDLSGRVLKVLADDYLLQGEHKLAFTTDQFANGIYFIEIKTTEATFNIKLIVQGNSKY